MQRLGVPVSGRIPADQRPLSGRAVARLTDLGWGQRVRELLDGPDAEAPEGLRQAIVAVLRDWDWDRRPVAVVSVPSRRRPQLVASVAAHLAEVGRLPHLGALELLDGGPTGEPGGNSAFRLAGVWGRIVVPTTLREQLAALDGPVLLVDDLVDSRWTMTLCAGALREAGADDVLPLAHAAAG
jgi:ATP-dependent DNA helicase RecQ